MDASYANHFKYASNSGYVMTLGVSAISWNSKRQPTIALSAAEAEYIAATDAGKEYIWWKTFLIITITKITNLTLIPLDQGKSCKWNV